MGTPYSPKLLDWNLTIRWFSVINRTLIGVGWVVLLLCKDAVGIFYSSSRLGCSFGGFLLHFVLGFVFGVSFYISFLCFVVLICYDEVLWFFRFALGYSFVLFFIVFQDSDFWICFRDGVFIFRIFLVFLMRPRENCFIFFIPNW